MSFVLQALIAAYMVVLEGFHFKRRYDEVNRTASQDPAARSRFYRFYLTLEWTLVGLIALALWLGGLPPAALGLRPPVLGSNSAFLAAVLPGILSGLFLPLLLARVPKVRAGLAAQLESLGQMVPVTGREQWQWAACAVTAGITEEIRFRGFLMMVVVTLFPSLPLPAALGITAALFGLAHWYQGWKGVLTTGLAGLLFGALAVYTQSLYIGIVTHALIDLRLIPLVWVVRATPASKG